ncbi:MAG: DUF6062 family protein [Clostridia bacterium]
MKEKIYTIPVNEAYAIDCECPLCHLEKQLETEAIDYALGAAMMEPDYRTESNEKGYCNKHYREMFKRPNKLSLALVLDTHLEEIRKKLDKFEKSANSLEKSGGGLFKKSGASELSAKISDTLSNTEAGCMICEKINKTMERYADVLLYMWANDDTFKEKFDKSKGVCLKHSKMLLDMSTKSLKDAQAAQFIAALYKKQKSELERIQDDIHKFTLKFDYRNKDMPWGTAQDAPIRTIEKISGYIDNNKEE